MAERSYYERIHACEAAIGRIRAAIRASTTECDAVGADLMLILQSIDGQLIAFAGMVRGYGPEAFGEALEALRDQVLDDIWSLGYVSMETQFGAYLKTRP